MPIPATIANGASQSNALRLNGVAIVGLQMPATWTAAKISFLVSVDGTTFQPLYDSTGTEVALTVAQATYVLINVTALYGFLHVKLRSGVAATPVNQGQESIVQVVTQELA